MDGPDEQTGKIPERWKTATLRILYKGKGDRASPDSFRGVALENTFFKVFTTILNRRLIEATEGNIPDHQFGFIKGRSTLHAVKYLMDQIEDTLRHPGGKYYTVFVDLKKAFDSLNRGKLIEKLKGMIGED
ncbi:hypothetical protein ANN_03270 [Periplaneta americana]|uniref:Reverse transcriptase domain-containing protein n=1 Tax=Periplaneta americana TaxID=6978 RepID=A0ABQ8TYN2_PERAM|nr:hypothetical protein ANN_03270 [Periplaneta americana]